VKPREGSSWRQRIAPWVRVRNRLRSGLLLLRGAWLQILQTAVAACAAWFLSVLILDVDRPTFAPIAAVPCLGLAVGERARRAIELTLGVAFGVAIADLLVWGVGVGAWQAGLVVALADPEDTRRLALEAAREASSLLNEREDLATSLAVNALVDQIHSSAVDLLGSTGMDRSSALQALEEATGRAS
jgi:hypothetical protein